MSFLIADRVKETTTTTGTGTVSLAGAVSGFDSFSAGIGNGNNTYYCISAGAEWEVGIGTYTAAGSTLSRDTVLSSSNADALVSFSVGTKDVFCTAPAGKLFTEGTLNAATSKATPVDADEIGLVDSAASWVIKKLTWANLKATLKTYFDTLYATIPILQNSQSAAYTLVLGDSGKHILHPSADTTARTYTIPANSAVPYDIGTALTFINQASAGVITIAITTDTMRLAGAGTTGSRTLAANGIATAIKLTTTEWIISGTGLT